jgi:hypothetical protein
MVHNSAIGAAGFMMVAAAVITGGIMLAAWLAEGQHRVNGGDIAAFSFILPTVLLMAIAMGVSWLILQTVVGSFGRRY